jgi:hypothetical protein
MNPDSYLFFSYPGFAMTEYLPELYFFQTQNINLPALIGFQQPDP